MMDYTLPIAKRTRLKEAEMWSKVHKEIKGMTAEERANASVSSSFDGESETPQKRGSRGRPRKSNGGGNMASDRDRVKEKGPACDCGADRFENLACQICGFGRVRPVVVDDSDDDVVSVNGGEEEQEKEVISIDDEDGDGCGGGGLGDGGGSNGSEVAENNGFNFVSVKRDSMEEDSNSGSKVDGSAKSRDALDSGLQEKGEDADDGGHDEVCFITDDSEEPESFSSEEDDEDDEDNDDSDDEDYIVSVEIEEVVEEDSRVLQKVVEKVKIDNKRKNDNACNKEDSVDCSPEPNCVAKRTRSHFSLDSGEKNGKLGNVCEPLPTDEVELQEDSNEEDAAAANETCSIGQTVEPKKRKRWSTEQENKKATIKSPRNYKAHEVIKILADSMLDNREIPCGDEKEPFIGPTLPLKFMFGAEESTTPEVPEDEKELEALWDELYLALEKDVTDTAVDVETDVSSESELDTAALCGRGEHQFILDEEIGLICKFCSFVGLEIKYYMPPFGKNPWGKVEKVNSFGMQCNIFDKLGSDYVCQQGQDPWANAQGTVWDIIPDIYRGMHAHQREGFEFLWKNVAGGIYLDELKRPASTSGFGGCVISHAPGTGKTRLAIAFLQTYMKLFPECRPLIIAPCGMLLTWEAEFQKWEFDFPFHNLNNIELSGKENSAALTLLRQAKQQCCSASSTRMLKLYSWKRDSSILGISYRLFEKLVGEGNEKGKKAWQQVEDHARKVLLELPGLLVLDEGHTPRNDQSFIWKALSRIQTDKRIILSGTPFQNNFDELFNTLCLVRPRFADRIASRYYIAPKRRGRKRSAARGNWALLTSVIGNEYNEKAGAERLQELREIIQPFVHVHKGNILQERLPGLRDSVVILEPVHLQKSILDGIHSVRDEFPNFNLEFAVTLVSVHPSLLRKGSLETDKLVIDWDRLKSLRLKPEAGVKTKFLMELVRLSGAKKEKVLVFSQYLDPLSFISKQLECRFNWIEGREVLCMHGQLEPDQRQSIMNNFNDPRSESKVLLASTRACSEGINLVGASRVVLLDVVWNPAVERQAISRAYRLGQRRVVHIYHLITSNTIEEEKYCRQVKKERLSELVFYSADKETEGQKLPSDILDENKDTILEEMVQGQKIKDMFNKIIYQPKDTDLVKSFGLIDL